MAVPKPAERGKAVLRVTSSAGIGSNGKGSWLAGTVDGLRGEGAGEDSGQLPERNESS
jgi:hypothetical protein